jgi:hypothetical protein
MPYAGNLVSKERCYFRAGCESIRQTDSKEMIADLRILEHRDYITFSLPEKYCFSERSLLYFQSSS